MLIVTGASGFIGSAMVWELNRRGHKDLLITDFVPPSGRRELLQGLTYNLFMDPDDLPRFLASTDARGVKGIFHMGACSTTTETDANYLKRVNTDYTKLMWELSAKGNWPLIYASSAAVYGDGALGFSDTPPSSRYNPLNLYGWSKLHFDVWAEAERLAPRTWYGLRFFNVYGPNEYFKGNMASLVFKATQQIQETGRLKLFRSHRPDYRDGEQKRDFVYVKDVVRWMYELFERQPTPSGIYNMGSGVARTWLDLARSVFAGLGLQENIEFIDIPENIRNQYQYFTESDQKRLMGIGLTPSNWSLERGVEDYVKNYLLREKRPLS